VEVVTTGTPVGWRERVERRPALVVVAVVAVLAAPYLLSGPEIMADDWVWIRNGEFLGWWDAGGSRQAGRPGAFVLYALTFGLIGPHPLVLALLQVGLWALAAVSVLRCLRAFIDPDVALAVTIAWLVIPSHTTLELWASTSQAWVALILLAEGLRLVRVAPERRWLGYVLLAACGPFYEVVMPVVPVGLAIDDRLRTGRFRWQPLAVGGALVAPALAWSLVASTVYPSDVGGTEGEVVAHLAASLAFGVPVQSPLAYAVVAGVAGIGYACLRVARRDGLDPDLAMIVAGLAIVVGGTAFALRSYLLPEGIGNRVTVASGVGAALVWVGVYRWARRSLDAGLVRIASAAVVLAVLLSTRVMYVADWIDTAGEGATAAQDVAEEVLAEPDHHLVLPEAPAVGEWTYALLDGWQTTASAQVVTGEADVVVNVELPERCLVTGPRSDDPLAQYGKGEAGLMANCARSVAGG